MSLGILGMFTSPEAAAAAGVKASGTTYYVDSKAPADAIVELVEIVDGKFNENKTNLHSNQPWLSVKFRVVSGNIGLSEKVGKGNYASVEGKEGDVFSMFFNLSAKQTEEDINRVFRRLASLAATLSGNRPGDYAPDGPLAGKVFEHLTSCPEGTRLRLTQIEANAKGYYNDQALTLVEEEAPAKKSKKSAA